MNNATLIERAKRFLASDGARKAALAIVPLALAASASAQLSNPGHSSGFDSGGGSPSGLTLDAIITNGGETLKMFGGFGPSTGAEWTSIQSGSNFHMRSTASIAGGVPAGTILRFDYKFTVAATGGVVSYTATDSMTGNDFANQSHTYSNTFTGSALGQSQGSLETIATITLGPSNLFQDFSIQWSGYAPTDTLTVTIPQTSLDSTVLLPVPEPASMLVLAGGAFALARRRRGK